MKIVAIEGGDQAGKETQARLLETALIARNIRVQRAGFPLYSSPIGRLIEDALHGRVEVEKLALTYLFEANKAEYQATMQVLEDIGIEYLILDRYLLSNHVYARAKGMPVSWVSALQVPLRDPDITLILDIDPVVSRRRKAQAELDLHERDLPLLQRVRELYQGYVNGVDTFLINANRDPQVIHKEMLRLLFSESGQILPE